LLISNFSLPAACSQSLLKGLLGTAGFVC
jgi:hypothetical protein